MNLFYPSFRGLLDHLLFMNLVLFLLYVTEAVPAGKLLPIWVAMNLILSICWFTFLRYYAHIRVEQNKISGPAVGLGRKTILLRQLDLRRTCTKTPSGKIWGYQDIWSVQGERIRFFRRMFNRNDFHQVLKLAQKYPFREGSSASI